MLVLEVGFVLTATLIGNVHILCQQPRRWGRYGKSDKRWHGNQARKSGIKSLNYVSVFQYFVFKYYHKLDLKHATTSNYTFLYISWQTLCEFMCGRVCVCVCVCGREGWEGLRLLIIFSSLYYPSVFFIPIPLKDKDVNWKFSQCKLQNASWHSFLSV